MRVSSRNDVARLSRVTCARLGATSSNGRTAIMNFRSLCAGVAALLAASSAVSAQSSDAGQYPNQRVTIVVPFSAGSNTDGQARIIADKLSEMWKQQVIVENRPGLPGTGSVA